MKTEPLPQTVREAICQFKVDCCEQECLRGRDFALGMEVGFSEFENQVMHATRLAFERRYDCEMVRGIAGAMGVEYGELLAERVVVQLGREALITIQRLRNAG